MTETRPPGDSDEAQVLAAWRALPRVEPPAALDARILAASRQQAPAMPAGGASPGRRPRWPAMWATAAVLTLAVGVSWQLRQQHPGAPTAPDAGIARPAPQEPSTDAVPAPLADAPERRQRDARAETGAAPTADIVGRASEAAVPAAPMPAGDAPAAKSIASNESVSDAGSTRAAAGVAADAAPMMQPAPMPQAKREAAMPQAAPPAATADAPPPSAPLAQVQAEMAAAEAAPVVAAAPAETPAAARAALPTDSDAAITRIRELLAAGRIDAAREAAAAFAVDHPQARLPDDLAWLAAPR